MESLRSVEAHRLAESLRSAGLTVWWKVPVRWGPPSGGKSPFGGGPPSGESLRSAGLTVWRKVPVRWGPPSGGKSPFGGGSPSGGKSPFGGGPPSGGKSPFGGGSPSGGKSGSVEAHRLAESPVRWRLTVCGKSPFGGSSPSGGKSPFGEATVWRKVPSGDLVSFATSSGNGATHPGLAPEKGFPSSPGPVRPKIT